MWVAGCGLRMSLNAFGCGRGTWVRMCIVLVGLLDSIDVDVYIDVNDVFFILLNLLNFFVHNTAFYEMEAAAHNLDCICEVCTTTLIESAGK